MPLIPEQVPTLETAYLWVESPLAGREQSANQSWPAVSTSDPSGEVVNNSPWIMSSINQDMNCHHVNIL